MQIADINRDEDESFTVNIYLTAGYKLISQRNDKLINIGRPLCGNLLLKGPTFAYLHFTVFSRRTKENLCVMSHLPEQRKMRNGEKEKKKFSRETSVTCCRLDVALISKKMQV